MPHAGGCHCGAVRYEVNGDVLHSALCHCSDCRKSSGAPAVAWAGFRAEDFRVTQGEARTINSSGSAYRNFCPTCGSGLFYTNEDMLPGIVDVQIATFDDPEAFPPQAHIQTAERLHWMEDMSALPSFARFPTPE